MEKRVERLEKVTLWLLRVVAEAPLITLEGKTIDEAKALIEYLNKQK